MDRAEKSTEIELLTSCFSKAQVALCADFRGLTVQQITTLRKNLKSAGATARVTKNTLARRSFSAANGGASEAQLKGFIDLLEGPSVLVFSNNDPIGPTKVLSAFVKESNEKLAIKGAWFEGQFLDKKGVEALSKMPGREEILARLLATIAAPASQLVRLLNEPGSQVARVIEAQRAKLAA